MTQNITRLVAAIFFLICVAVNPAAAQWNTYLPNDTVVRPANFVWTVANVDATTTTLNAGTSDIIVTAFDISSAATTSVPAASIHDELLRGARRLAVEFKEASGSGLKGTATFNGTDVFGQPISDKIYTAGGIRYAYTTHAYATINSITLALSGNATSDTFRVGVFGYGIPARTSAFENVSVTALTAATTGQTTATLTTALTYTTTDLTPTTGVWNSTYSTFYKSTAFTVGDLLQFQYYNDLQTNAPSGLAGTINAVISTSGTQGTPNLNGFGYGT